MDTSISTPGGGKYDYNLSSTDVAGGYSPSVLNEMRTALHASRALHLNLTRDLPADYTALTLAEGFYMATMGGAEGMHMQPSSWAVELPKCEICCHTEQHIVLWQPTIKMALSPAWLKSHRWCVWVDIKKHTQNQHSKSSCMWWDLHGEEPGNMSSPQDGPSCSSWSHPVKHHV